MDRALLAFTADGRPVGTAAAYSFELTLPGEILAPAAGVSAVGVLPSHRRQGVLTAMTRHQLTDLRARGKVSPYCWPPRPRSTRGSATEWRPTPGG
jgi:GNAT superfamily N-acetyltransferase